MTRKSSTVETKKASNDVPSEQPAAPRLGRKRDPSRDAAILEATLDVLADVGYASMTMDMVALRAKAGKATVYRRWPSKVELALDAVGRLKRKAVDLEHLPDTGNLRGDLIALFKPQSNEEGERTMKIMAGLAAMLSYDQAFAEAGNAALIEPWADAHRLFMQRAIDRGEISATADIDALSQVLPCMAAYRTLIQRKPFERDFLVSIIDGVILPALKHPAPTVAAKRMGRKA